MPVARPEALPAKKESKPTAEELAKKQAETEAAAAKALRDFAAAVQLNEAGRVIHVNLLNHPRCNDDAMEPLKSLKSVVAIDLRGTKITDAGLSAISGLTSLEELYLGGTTITDVGLAKLKSLAALASSQSGTDEGFGRWAGAVVRRSEAAQSGQFAEDGNHGCRHSRHEGTVGFGSPRAAAGH